jgi:energy-coupling factor transporter ATP-binding protein EcfA2
LLQLRDDGVAILLATHDVELVAEVATRVILLGDGRIVADGGPRTVLSGSLTFTTTVNKLYGDGFITAADILTGLGISDPPTSSPSSR